MVYVIESPLWFIKIHKETVSGSFRALQRNQKVGINGWMDNVRINGLMDG